MTQNRCSTCPGKYRCVPGDGPLDAKVVCIGEAPGREEDAGGRPFIGQAGREFNENYLNLAGLSRDEVYITNTVKCRPDLNRKPGEKEALGCARHFIPGELAEIQPEVVILMGATACRLLEGEKVDLETDHGIPRLGEVMGWAGWVVPMYHPAAGLHDTAMMQPMLEDWAGLRAWLGKGTWRWATDEFEGKREYRLAQTWGEVSSYYSRYNFCLLDKLVAIDTESHDGQEYSIQISLKPGTAIMVLMKDQEAIRGLMVALRLLVENGYELVFHNEEADIDIVRRLMGTDQFMHRDTMKEAYGFGNLRQGLKSLSKRLLGRTRKSWEETVMPPSKEKLSNWMADGFMYAEKNWRRWGERVSEKTGKMLKPKLILSEPEKLLRELNGYMIGNDEYPIWDKLEERMAREYLDALVQVVGPIPRMGIAHCSLEEQVEYGCSDADDTLRLALLFDRMRVELVDQLGVEEEDWDGQRV